MLDDKRILKLLEIFQEDMEECLDTKVNKLRNEILGRETDEDNQVQDLSGSESEEEDEEE